ncbi:Hpt domain-containing protein [Sphaerotilus natans]|uniref:Hpt domain-containing protein n=1 Tax=Sphaerotilus natans TaxID=34103 RepID=UPI00406D3DB1
MSSPRDTAPTDDLSALAWVHDELRRTLESAQKSLRRYLREVGEADRSDLDDVDPSILRQARQQIHQGAGALELVNLPEAALVMRSAEQLVQRFVARPQRLDSAGVEAVEKALFALLDFLARKLAGQPVQPVGLFAQWRTLLELTGAERIHPADLWRRDWQWHALPAAVEVPAALVKPADATQLARFEKALLVLMRQNHPGAAAALSRECAVLGAASAGHEQALWRLAAAFFEAWALALLTPDLYVKRSASRVMGQLRGRVKGDPDLSDRLAQDLLFHCARAWPAEAQVAPWLRAVHAAWHLSREPLVSYDEPLYGRRDPALVLQARRRLQAAKEAWDAAAAGDAQRMLHLGETFSLVGDSVSRLYADGRALADALRQAAETTLRSGRAPQPELGMEVATSLLYLEAAIDEGDFDGGVAAPAHRLAERIGRVLSGHPAQPLEPWMEELYRRVSDRQTLGSVVQELRGALLEVERQIDQFFRSPHESGLLAPVPGQLGAMRGVLSVLGLDAGISTLQRMRADVEQLLHDDRGPQDPVTLGAFQRLAANLGALGFLVDMLGVQPQVARTLFVFDERLGVLAPLMGRSAVDAEVIERAEALVEAVREATLPLDQISSQLQALQDESRVAAVPALSGRLEAARQALQQADGAGLAQAVQDFVATATAPLDFDPLGPPLTERPLAPPPLAEPPAFAPTGLEDDHEMRDVFLEESREVIADATDALRQLEADPASLTLITRLRRAFHTLKGSARMVGLNAYGEAAWSCEQLYNHWLAAQVPATPNLRTLTGDAIAYLSAWTEAIAGGDAQIFLPEPLIAAAEAMRQAGELMRVVLPGDSRPLPMPAPAHAPSGLSGAEPAVDLEVDLEVPIGTQTAPLMEPLQATRPMDLPLLPEAAHEGPPPVELLDLDLDAPHPVSQDATALDLDLGLDLDLTPEPARDPAPVEPVTVIAEAVVADTQSPATTHAGGLMAESDLVREPVGPITELEPLTLEMAAADAAPAGAEVIQLEEFRAQVGAEVLRAAQPERDPDADQIKVIGPLRLQIPLFNIYLNEADEVSRRLGTELTLWSMELPRALDAEVVVLAHRLAGNSATVGFTDLAQLARLLEQALQQVSSLQRHALLEAGDAELFVTVSDDIRRLLHQFAAGFLRPASPAVLERLQAWIDEVPRRLPAPTAGLTGDRRVDAASDAPPLPPSLPVPASSSARQPDPELEADIDQIDQVDADLFPVFSEEAQELLPLIEMQGAAWLRDLDLREPAPALMRALHTFKGGARLAGAMRLGEMAHRLESAVEALGMAPEVAGLQRLSRQIDALSAAFDALCARQAGAPSTLTVSWATRPAPLPPVEPSRPNHPPQAAMISLVDPPRTATTPAGAEAAAAPPPAESAPVLPPAQPGEGVDWSRYLAAAAAMPAMPQPPERAPVNPQPLRVRAPLLDRLVNLAGEVSITRSRLESELAQIRGSLGDLTDNLERLGRQLHDVTLQADTQLESRQAAARAAAQEFDPLELDRYTRLQELTRMMAESVNDVATVRGALQRTLQTAEDELAAQARLTRELQGDLLRTRMVEFESLSERLYRVVRLAAKETGRQVRFDIVGGSIEVDRGVLDRMNAVLEHLLRNCVTHGIEPPEQRQGAGKDPTGSIVITLEQEGNEVSVEVRDDGAGLDLPRIRRRAVEMGLIAEDARLDEHELANLIFAPGLSTVEVLTEVAGRGVGMDVVKSEVQALGGRIEILSRAGRGTRFRLVMPLTTVVTQVVLLRAGSRAIAVPSHLVELVQRQPLEQVQQAAHDGQYLYGGLRLPFYWLGALLGGSGHSLEMAGARTLPLVVVRSAQQRVALQVDEVLGSHEVVVKNLGPQLSRLPGLAGMTLLASGAVALIYNPVTLAAVYGAEAQQLMQVPEALPQGAAPLEPVRPAPLVLVVDDSLTVRRITRRLLEREGLRVALAKDGMEALELLAGERPAVVLSDIEMPRMDGFDLLRNIRGDSALADLPVIMITSRIAQKHRDLAHELGADGYLGKPYGEEELLRLIRRHADVAAPLPL